MSIRGDGDLIIQTGESFATWGADMTELLNSINGAVGTLQDTWESVASNTFRTMVDDAMPHLQSLAEFMTTNSSGLVNYGNDLNYMANTYYVTTS